MPTETIYMHFQYRHDGPQTAYVKGLDVGSMRILETNQHYLFPTHGTDLDLTALQAPDPRVLLLGVGSPVKARENTWGQLKIRYR